MQTEQHTSQEAFDQSTLPAQRQEGTLFNDGDNLGIDIGEIARQKKIASALADATAATQQTQPSVEMIEKRLEYVPLPQEIVHMMGVKIVRGLRKPHNENNINLFDDSELAAPYLSNKESGQDNYINKAWNPTEPARDSLQEDPKEASWKGFHEQSF